MNKLFSVLTVMILALVSGCAQKKKDVVTIKTNYGDMVAILYDETPQHKANFIKLAKEHFFDGTLFHRVIPGFMIQGGDPDSKKAVAGERLGTGGPGYTVPAEFNPKLFHEKGALSAARLGDEQNPTKASSGSQFYIVQGAVIPQEDLNNLRYDQTKMMEGLQQMIAKPENKPLLDSLNGLSYAGDMIALQKKIYSLVPRIEKETSVKVMKDVAPEKLKVYGTIGGTPQLDDGYTVFGKVIKGLEVIDKIAAVSRDQSDRPLEDVKMVVSVEQLSVSEVEKKYGYRYADRK
jgi:peptidyl-prolyl cis-trans isomerase B (cyclophilin B)